MTLSNYIYFSQKALNNCLKISPISILHGASTCNEHVYIFWHRFGQFHIKLFNVLPYLNDGKLASSWWYRCVLSVVASQLSTRFHWVLRLRNFLASQRILHPHFETKICILPMYGRWHYLTETHHLHLCKIHPLFGIHGPSKYLHILCYSSTYLTYLH